MATYGGYTYSNGYVPRAVLDPLDGDNYGDETAYLRRDAAKSWNLARVVIKERKDITLTVRGWNRTFAEQDQFFHERYVKGLASSDQRYHVHSGVGAWYGLKAGSAPAAIPGTSNHGWGLAVDVVDFGAYGTTGNARRAATIGILREYGWTDTEGMSIEEPWHLVYNPANDQHKNDEVDDMSAQAESDVAEILHLLKAGIEDGDLPRGDVRDSLRKDLILARRNSRDIKELLLEMSALRAAVATLAENAGLDPAEVTAILKESISAAVKNWSLTLNTEE